VKGGSGGWSLNYQTQSLADCFSAEIKIPVASFSGRVADRSLRGNALSIAHSQNKYKTFVEDIDGFLRRTPDLAAHQERNAIARKRVNPRAHAVEPPAWRGSRRIEIPPPTADRSLHRGFLLPRGRSRCRGRWAKKAPGGTRPSPQPSPEGEGASNNASAARVLWRDRCPPWQVSEKALPVSHKGGKAFSLLLTYSPALKRRVRSPAPRSAVEPARASGSATRARPLFPRAVP
jgi:hypothetical protein